MRHFMAESLSSTRFLYKVGKRAESLHSTRFLMEEAGRVERNAAFILTRSSCLYNTIVRFVPGGARARGGHDVGVHLPQSTDDLELP